MTTPANRLVHVVVEVDPDFIDTEAPTGLTTAGHIELREAVNVIGNVAHLGRATTPTPAPPTVPISSERTRAYSRRREALEKATLIAARQQVGKYDADIVLNMARMFEAYLNGEQTEGAN